MAGKGGSKPRLRPKAKARYGTRLALSFADRGPREAFISPKVRPKASARFYENDSCMRPSCGAVIVGKLPSVRRDGVVDSISETVRFNRNDNGIDDDDDDDDDKV